MRARLTVLGAVLLVSGCGGSNSTATTTKTPTSTSPHGLRRAPATATSGLVTATLYAPTRTPEANAKWRYRVVVTDKKRRKLAGKITVQIVDPLGRAHAATYDDTPKPIANMAFNGSFHDYVEWPADSRGYTLTFRVIANTPKGQVTITYPVTPK